MILCKFRSTHCLFIVESRFFHPFPMTYPNFLPFIFTNVSLLGSYEAEELETNRQTRSDKTRQFMGTRGYGLTTSSLCRIPFGLFKRHTGIMKFFFTAFKLTDCSRTRNSQSSAPEIQSKTLTTNSPTPL